jgi:drug/metabolite transporter (DMT)-like permease
MPLSLIVAATLTAFAANSLLCRMALGDALIDPVAFTVLRLGSGAAILVVLTRFSSEPEPVTGSHGSWGSALGLFAYAMAFSLAYISLPAGVGALILFGAVQLTMIGFGLLKGERLRVLQWFGLIIALAGLIWLVSPGLAAPDPVGAILMSISGFAWGCYSIRGKGAAAPIKATAENFIRTLPMVIIAAAITLSSIQAEPTGIMLAIVSGSITSGLGYVLWYHVLREMATTRAAVLQLLVPIIAAIGGILFLSEAPSIRLLGASALILGGVALAVVKRGNSSS